MAGQVLDTSAIIAYLYDEQGADLAERVIFGSGPVAVPFIALMEVEYKLIREIDNIRTVAQKMQILLNWPVDVFESDVRWRHEAALAKSRGEISLADAWIASLALMNDAELVHKDPEFDTVPGLKALRLPYDRDLAGSAT